MGGIETAIPRRVAKCEEVVRGCPDRVLDDVLGEDPFGLAFGNDSSHLWPEVVGVGSPSGCVAEGLARKPTSDDVDEPSPGASFELTDVGEEGEPGETPVGLAGREDPLTIGPDLDGADGAVPE